MRIGCVILDSYVHVLAGKEEGVIIQQDEQCLQRILFNQI